MWMLMLMLYRLGPDDGWGGAKVIALLVVGAVLLVGFVFWERVYPTPLMPPHIWKDRNFTLVGWIR